jgi:glycerophosphoryl diester phosphodiesterase
MSKLIAHRGLSSLAFENTEESFLLAANKKEVFGIETDI